jgi:hypothetical protein
MKQAFSPKDGPLRDPLSPPGEQVALMELMAGAIDPEVETQFRRRFAAQPQNWEMEGTGEALTL